MKIYRKNVKKKKKSTEKKGMKERKKEGINFYIRKTTRKNAEWDPKGNGTSVLMFGFHETMVPKKGSEFDRFWLISTQIYLIFLHLNNY